MDTKRIFLLFGLLLAGVIFLDSPAEAVPYVDWSDSPVTDTDTERTVNPSGRGETAVNVYAGTGAEGAGALMGVYSFASAYGKGAKLIEANTYAWFRNNFSLVDVGLNAAAILTIDLNGFLDFTIYGSGASGGAMVDAEIKVLLGEDELFSYDYLNQALPSVVVEEQMNFLIPDLYEGQQYTLSVYIHGCAWASNNEAIGTVDFFDDMMDVNITAIAGEPVPETDNYKFFILGLTIFMLSALKKYSYRKQF
ncbi:MAG: hypothetical protein ABH836_00185 [Candidatus Omnitrophota bacterium]